MTIRNLKKENESLKTLEECYWEEIERHCAGYYEQEGEFKVDDIILPDLFKVML